jgi:hypothetical protein
MDKEKPEIVAPSDAPHASSHALQVVSDAPLAGANRHRASLVRPHGVCKPRQPGATPAHAARFSRHARPEASSPARMPPQAQPLRAHPLHNPPHQPADPRRAPPIERIHHPTRATHFPSRRTQFP